MSVRVFVSEYMVGGALAGKPGAKTMCQEGLAMLRAVMEDIARLSGYSVVTTLQADLSVSFAGEVILIHNADQERDIYLQLLKEVDAVLVIAPETGGILAERCRMVRAAGVASWNCAPEAIELCTDKFKLAGYLQRHQLATIPTYLANLGGGSEAPSKPVVLKPRDGAGSRLTFLIRHREDWIQAVNEIVLCGEANNCLIQPFISGRTLSVGVNIGLDGNGIRCLEVGDQRLSDDGRFQYRGGVIPAVGISASVRDSIQSLVLNACQSIPGLKGYVGFDLILTEENQPLIVEINPRLTSSYVGYRQLAKISLPRQWLGEFPQIAAALPAGSSQIPDRIEFDVSSFLPL